MGGDDNNNNDNDNDNNRMNNQDENEATWQKAKPCGEEVVRQNWKEVDKTREMEERKPDHINQDPDEWTRRNI